MATAVRSPFHRGERDIQSRLGVREQIEDIGQRFIRDYMPDEHRQFYAKLPIPYGNFCTNTQRDKLSGRQF
jgi:hypothetical protein